VLLALGVLLTIVGAVLRVLCLNSQSCVLQAPRVDDSTSEGKPYFLRCYLQQKLTKNAKFAFKRCFNFQTYIYFINSFKFFEFFGLTILRLKIKLRFYYLKINFKYIFTRILRFLQK